MTQSPSASSNPLPKFSLGEVLFSLAATTDIVAEDVSLALKRHRFGDWGDVSASDKLANEDALQFGGRLFSAYQDRKQVKFWIITEHDRNQTSVLLPDDYKLLNTQPTWH